MDHEKFDQTKVGHRRSYSPLPVMDPLPVI
jgi:hypothetical protein